MMTEWWADHKGKRMTLEALDTILAIMPAAIAGVILSESWRRTKL